MRLGILTFHRAHNYGAVLQTYALQQCLQSMGHDVWVIDYRQPQIEIAYRPFRLRTWLSSVIHVRKTAFSYLKGYPLRKKRQKNFVNFVNSYLHLTSPCSKDNIPDDFDVYLIGSDQLWNWACTANIIDPVYTGNIGKNTSGKIVGYAISSKLAAIDTIGVKGLKETLDKFSAISIREDMVAKVMGCLTGTTPEVCCDPTILTNSSFWDKITNEKYKNRKYVLMYEVRKPKGNPKYLLNKAKELAEQMGCEVINASRGDYAVEDWVSLFKYASYVVTTSFHGTVFSLIFHRPFYSIKLKDRGDSRYENLLEAIGAYDFCVDMDFKPVAKKLDYTLINEGIKNYRSGSLKFLMNLQGVGG